jgi:hypothetical protein
MKEENGLDGGKMSPNSINKRRKLVTSNEWKSETGSIVYEKVKYGIRKTRNDPEWIETVGKEAARKCSDTKNSKEWQETVGIHVAEEARRRQSDPLWTATKGVEKSRNYSSTVNSKEWLETNGKERSRKQSEKAKNRVKRKCEYCDIECSGSNFTRWHNTNCKNYKLQFNSS